MNNILTSHIRNSRMSLNEVYFWTDTIKDWKHLLKTEKYKDLLSDANRKAIWDLTDEATGQFKRGDLIEIIFNQWSVKYKNYQNLNDVIPNYKTLDFDGVLNNANEVVSLKTYQPKLATEKTLSVITSKIDNYASKLSTVTIDASHAGKIRVLDFTIQKGVWTDLMVDINKAIGLGIIFSN